MITFFSLFSNMNLRAARRMFFSPAIYIKTHHAPPANEINTIKNIIIINHISKNCFIHTHTHTSISHRVKCYGAPPPPLLLLRLFISCFALIFMRIFAFIMCVCVWFFLHFPLRVEEFRMPSAKLRVLLHTACL